VFAPNLPPAGEELCLAVVQSFHLFRLVWCPQATVNLIAVLMDPRYRLGPLRYIFISANGLHLYKPPPPRGWTWLQWNRPMSAASCSSTLFWRFTILNSPSAVNR